MTLTLPEPRAVLDLLSMFIGGRPPLAPSRGMDLTMPAYGTYVCWLNAADGTTEGAILTDLAATLYIGGGLIMMPENALREMGNRGEVSDAVLDGLGEVFNNVRGLLNRIKLNPHVTPTDPVLYDPPAADSPQGWIYLAERRVDLHGHTAFGPATLTLIGR
ncbi:MAG: hypothetical protein RBT60_10265 [Candidatus Krumholzibacteria bacterium]|nr:hypothetical protein [Candidatus Krumholzibacteria bacterium]